jgi:hypothetical protein
VALIRFRFIMTLTEVVFLVRAGAEKSGGVHDAYSAASLTYWPLPTGQAAHSSLSAAMRCDLRIGMDRR